MVKKRRKNISTITVCIALFLAVISCTGQKQTSIKKVDLLTLKQDVIGKNVQFIDVRSPKEYNEGHIDDAINMNIAEVDNFIKQTQQLDKNKPVYLYCYTGGRSGKASKILAKAGFTSIYDFTGGWKAWSKDLD